MSNDPDNWHKVLGIFPINPSGEMSSWQFMTSATNIKDARKRLISNYSQAVLCVLFLVLFIRNTWRSFLLINRRARSIANWCCFIQAAACMFLGFTAVSAILPIGPSCRKNGWIAFVALTISSIAVHICLLSKAYTVRQYDRRLIWIGGILLVPWPISLWLCLRYSQAYHTNEDSCVIEYPSYIPWVRFTLDSSINIIFTVVFLRVVLHLYRTIGSKCWQQLSSDGLLYLFGVITSNFITAVITATDMLDGVTEIMFLIDALVTSLLLIRQHERMQTVLEDRHIVL
ncbi:hypothetical protein BDF19DRAFT_428941 [Syncephalis fuscata]|nr:hypothetical protein BDF19DRAFT_428941 [Syncephalis fuscata]